MAMNFYPPAQRAAASDLTIAISPLGLVELSDEEFEVNGPRMQRYAANWAWYLGHHHMYRREMGEPQLVFNYVRAFADFINSFTFGKGIMFHSPEATSAIVPYLLQTVWEEHNDKPTILWEIGQYGGISGDVFVKVAYEPPYVNPTNNMPMPGRVRVLPLNPAFCFPVWHPHDRSRMIQFKQKYKFWAIADDGSRQVMTYTEIVTDTSIQEYVNDEMINERVNPLGIIPIAYTQNFPVASSPWGLSDIQDIISLNREYNEKAITIGDIINYYSAPVTVVLGAKASNLERGPRKVWAIPSKDARVENLQLMDDLAGPLGYMELIKQAMHEMTGVPAQALGQMQPVSNTSGVALQIQYQPLMNRYAVKRIQYTRLFKTINELVIRTAALYEPQLLAYNPVFSSAMIKPDQYDLLDITDPVSVRSTIVWPSPMPMDILLTINEVQAKMAMGLESKRGALRELGENFPDQKMREVFEELVEDTKESGALQMLQAQVSALIMMSTGMTPDGQPLVVPGQVDEQGNQMGGPAVDPALFQELMNMAYGATPPERHDFDTSDSAL